MPSVAYELGAQGLDRHLLLERPVLCQVDGAHGLVAQRGHDPVVADLLPHHCMATGQHYAATILDKQSGSIGVAKPCSSPATAKTSGSRSTRLIPPSNRHDESADVRLVVLPTDLLAQDVKAARGRGLRR